MDDSRPLVSINVVTRNRCTELLRALESAYAQTYRPIELVVVDNCSDDGSAEAVETRWPDVKIIRIHRNVGCQPGRNIGMKNCRGMFVFNLDDDGVLERTAIARIVERFETEPDLGVICAATPPLDSRSLSIDEDESAVYRGSFRGGASAIKASVLIDVGYFPEYPRGGAEKYLAIRALDRGYELLLLPQAVMYHPRLAERPDDVMGEYAYYVGWHNLKTPLQIEPWPGCGLSAIWGTFRGMLFWLPKGHFLAYLRGIGRFFFDLPDVWAGRHTVSRKAVRKQQFLTYNSITDGGVARDFKTYPLLSRLGDRWRNWRRKN